VRIGDAHEALSDVRALIGIARKFKQAQPKLWEYALRLRDKRFAAGLLDVIAMTPALHVSQRYPAARLCAAPVIPLSRHPRIDNRVLVFDLAQDPQALLTLAPDEIADRLYTPFADLPEGEERVALKEVHLNRCPALIAWNHLRPADFERLQIDPAVAERRAAQIREAGQELVDKVRRVNDNDQALSQSDVYDSLYDAFIGDGDKRLFRNVRTTRPEALGAAAFEFRDARLPELLFRYRARNWPQTLSATEHQRWNEYRRQRLYTESGMSEYSFDRFRAELLQARAAAGEDGAKQALLDRLEAWAGEIDRDL
ncbi:exodeoxyribonuclease I, partial [Lysobacter sp. 2RAB21]